MYQADEPAASVFTILRQEVPIDRVIEANGSGKAHCAAPDHRDTNPSMHLYDDHVHCFSCGFHGDVVDVWAAIQGIDRPIEAALGLAREFNVKLPEMGTEAKARAQEHREKQGTDLRLAQVCHGALEKHPHVREWWEGRGFGPELRQRFLLGANRDGTEAVIPYWRMGRVEGLIRRRLDGEPKYRYPSNEEFADGHRPLFVPVSVRNEVFLVEGIVDALAVAAVGRSAIAVGGTDLSEAQSAELRKILLNKDARLYILPDRDSPGAEAARRWARSFSAVSLICGASYGEGGKDIADTFAVGGCKETAEHLDRLAKGARDMIDIETDSAAKIEGDVRQKLAYVTENVVPLLAKVQPAGLQDATADIVADRVEGIKKSWLIKALKDENERVQGEHFGELLRERQRLIERAEEERRKRVEEAQEEIDELFAAGVLGRLRDSAAAMHNVYGDEEALELALLVALGAQLEPLPNGRPLGASILLTAEAGRGKNHIVDAAVKPLPEEFYFAFEIASGQSLYYKADEDPGFLKHTFAYPNEIEGAEALWEFLRPMLSKGLAKKVVTAKDADGNMTTRTIVVEGPVTIAIPTIRNKTDEQLQTRLLVAELPDYPGRVKSHAAAVSEQLLPDAAATDYSRTLFLWQEGLRQLTQHRRVVFPLKHEDFALDNDKVSHGARLWANLLGLMAAHAWLEQKNRRLLDLSEEGDGGRVAIEATPADYEAAYRVFGGVCRRTVVNLSDTHRKILGALHDLHNEFPNREGFPQREIAGGADLALGTISKNKAFLVSSAKLIKETEYGLALVEGADPSWWAAGGVMEGLPTPEQVRAWWSGGDPPSPEPGEQVNTDPETPEKHARNGGSSVHHPGEHPVNMFTRNGDGPKGAAEPSEHVHVSSTEGVNTENSLGKANSGEGEEAFTVFTRFGGSGDGSNPHTPEEVLGAYLRDPPDWFRNQAEHALRHDPDLPEYLIKPLATSTAYEALGDAHKSSIALPFVRTKLEGMKAPGDETRRTS